MTLKYFNGKQWRKYRGKKKDADKLRYKRWRLYNINGTKILKTGSYKECLQRMREVEFFKHRGE